MKGILIYCICA